MIRACMRRAAGMIGLAVALLLGWQSPASAILVHATVTITWLVPPPPIAPGTFAGATGFQTGFFFNSAFTSQGMFGTTTIPGNPVIPGNPIFIATPSPPEIIPGSAVVWSFAGTTTNDVAGSFPTFAFPAGIDPPFQPPGAAPLVTLAQNLQPGFAPIDATGPIYAYDAPVQIGNFEVTLTEVPEPSAMLLLSAGLIGLGTLRAGRRRSGVGR